MQKIQASNWSDLTSCAAACTQILLTRLSDRPKRAAKTRGRCETVRRLLELQQWTTRGTFCGRKVISATPYLISTPHKNRAPATAHQRRHPRALDLLLASFILRRPHPDLPVKSAAFVWPKVRCSTRGSLKGKFERCVQLGFLTP